MILTTLRSGEIAKIVAIEGGQGLRQKLLLRGVSEGSIVRMVSSNRGPVVLEINGSTIAIGRGMAKRIIVQK
ncbi:MAG: ferrous iron transport protein A [Deltaproteobacteria bacterium]|nr:ferrous iron transport protein A [Deltaproteobacteria bacterium]